MGKAPLRAKSIWVAGIVARRVLTLGKKSDTLWCGPKWEADRAGDGVSPRWGFGGVFLAIGPVVCTTGYTLPALRA
jgi:hypothetical protein